MKRLIAIFTILIITASSLHKTIVFSYYEYNKTYIIENLCINKEEPEIGCEGKCYLMNKVNEEKAQGILIQILKNIKDEIAQVQGEYIFNTLSIENKYYTHNLSNYTLLREFNLIKPPNHFLNIQKHLIA
ncbi:MAG: hypothetical protein ACK45U_04305 [bacterium]|jgi:hypothetical protein